MHVCLDSGRLVHHGVCLDSGRLGDDRGPGLLATGYWTSGATLHYIMLHYIGCIGLHNTTLELTRVHLSPFSSLLVSGFQWRPSHRQQELSLIHI